MSMRITVSVLVVFLIAFLACSKGLRRYEYVPNETFPKMVYIENQVQSLNTRIELSKNNRIFVEVRRKSGESQYGRLIRITESDLVVSQGFYYSTKDDSTFKKESKVVIPKGDVFILKVW